MPDNVVALVQPEATPGMARLNVTWAGQNGDLPDFVAFDLPDDDVRRIATEAVVAGSIPGVARVGAVDFTDFVVDRYARDGVEPSHVLFLRPKVPFGTHA